MTPSERIIWALFVKNNQQQGQMKGWLLIGFMALVGFYDGVRPMSPFAWLGLAYWCVVLAISAGAGSFGHDFKFNSIRFLEYLPVRRWHMWAANWLDGLISIWLPVLLSIWLRVLLWPGDGQPPANRYGPEFAQYLLMPDRWSLLFGALAVTYCGFAVSAFFRVSIQKDSAVFVRAIGGAILVLSAVWIAPVAYGCMPSLGDAAIPLFAIGALFTLASLYAFHMRWRNWGAVRSWLFVSLPSLTFLIISSGAILAFACMRWARYEPRASDTIHAVVLDESRGVLVRVSSFRSGTHAFHVDPATKRSLYLGRELTAPVQMALGISGAREITTELSSESFGNPLELFERGEYRSPSLGAQQFTDSAGTRYYVRRWQRTSDGESIVFAASPHGRGADETSVVLITDLDGNVHRKVPASWTSDFILTRDGRLLVENPSSDERSYGDVLRPPPTYTMYKLDSSESRRIEMPGHPIRIEPELSAALCRKIESRDGKIHRAIVLYNFATGESTNILGEEAFPVFDASDSSKFEMLTYQPASPARQRSIYEIDHVKICLEDFLRVVPFVRADRNNRPTSGLMVLDRSTGKVRELVRQDQLIAPTTQPTRGARYVGFNLVGFNNDRGALRYETEDELREVQLTDGTQRVLARRPDGAPGMTCEVSPDASRVLVQAYRPDDERNRRSGQHIVQVWCDGAMRWTDRSEDDLQPQWINDRELLMTDKSRVLRVNADTGERTPIFSTDSAVAR